MPVFCEANKDYIVQEAGEKYESKVVLFLTDDFFFGLSKTETLSKLPKLGYFDGRVTKLSSRVTLATSEAGVVCHMMISFNKR